MKLFWLCFLLTSCGSVGPLVMKDPRQFKTTNPILLPYIDSFEQATGKTVGDVPVNFSKTWPNQFGDAAAACIKWGKNVTFYREVLIYPDQKEKLQGDYSYEMEQLIWHELGHCVLYRKHDNTALGVKGVICDDVEENSKCAGYMPKSIMRWVVFNPLEIMFYYMPNREKYIEELKTGVFPEDK